MLSARHASTIYKINGTDGSIIWRLGGNWSDFKLGHDVEFGFQHHARYLEDYDPETQTETISLFDNSFYGSESGGGGDKQVQIYPYSRGKYIKLDYKNMEATLVKAFIPPGGIIAKSQGSLQTLPNQNVLINWGSEGAITEYSPDGEPIFHAFLDSGILQDGVQNYRAFRFNWTGYADETVAVANQWDKDTNETTIYVSWNGDTLTKHWKFYQKGVLAAPKLLGEKQKAGFETVFKTNGIVPNVFAEAIDERGHVLTVSDVEQAVHTIVLPAKIGQSYLPTHQEVMEL